MTTNIECHGSAGPSGARRDHRPKDGAPGFRLVPLTLRDCKRTVYERIGYRTARGESAGIARTSGRAAVQAVSPAIVGRNQMPRHRAPSRLPAGNHPSHDLRKNCASTSAIVALALTAGLWFANPGRAQETQISFRARWRSAASPARPSPISRKGCRPASIRWTRPSSTSSAPQCAFSTFPHSAARRPGQLVYPPQPFEVTGRPDRPGLRADL